MVRRTVIFSFSGMGIIAGSFRLGIKKTEQGNQDGSQDGCSHYFYEASTSYSYIFHDNLLYFQMPGICVPQNLHFPSWI